MSESRIESRPVGSESLSFDGPNGHSTVVLPSLPPAQSIALGTVGRDGALGSQEQYRSSCEDESLPATARPRSGDVIELGGSVFVDGCEKQPESKEYSSTRVLSTASGADVDSTQVFGIAGRLQEVPLLVSAAACAHCRSSRCCIREAGIDIREVKIQDTTGAAALRQRWKSSTQWTRQSPGATSSSGGSKPSPIARSGFAVVVPVLFVGKQAIAGAERIREWVVERNPQVRQVQEPRACGVDATPGARPCGDGHRTLLGKVIQGTVADIWPADGSVSSAQRPAPRNLGPSKLATSLAKESGRLAKISSAAARLASMLPSAASASGGYFTGRYPGHSAEQAARWQAACGWAQAQGVRSPLDSKGANLFGFGGKQTCLHGREAVALVAAVLLFRLSSRRPGPAAADGAGGEDHSESKAGPQGDPHPLATSYAPTAGAHGQADGLRVTVTAAAASSAMGEAEGLCERMVRRGMLVRAGRSGLLAGCELARLAAGTCCEKSAPEASEDGPASSGSEGEGHSSGGGGASVGVLSEGRPGVIECVCESTVGTGGSAVASPCGSGCFPRRAGAQGASALWRWAADEAAAAGGARSGPVGPGYRGVGAEPPLAVPPAWTAAVVAPSDDPPGAGGGLATGLLRCGLTLPAAASQACLERGLPLNCTIAYLGPPVDPLSLAKDLHSRQLELLEDTLSMCGHYVDYRRMRAGRALARYVEAAAALQACDPAVLPPAHRAAFFLNLYNALCLHALALLCTNPKSEEALAEPSHSATRGAEAPAATLSAWGRRKLFGSGGVSYRIGPWKYTLDDIEHGVLRGDRSPPSVLPQWMCGPPLGEGDARSAAVLRPGLGTDCRVHFALVCGARACPPLRLYDAETPGTESNHGDSIAAAQDEQDITPPSLEVARVMPDRGDALTEEAAAGGGGADDAAVGPRLRRRRSASRDDGPATASRESPAGSTAASGAGSDASSRHEEQKGAGGGRPRTLSPGSSASGTSDHSLGVPELSSEAEAPGVGLPGLESPLGHALDLAAEAYLSDTLSLDARLGKGAWLSAKERAVAASSGGVAGGRSRGADAWLDGDGCASDSSVLWAWAAAIQGGSGFAKALEEAKEAGGAAAAAAERHSFLAKAGSVHLRISKLFCWYKQDFGGAWREAFGLGAAVGWDVASLQDGLQSTGGGEASASDGHPRLHRLRGAEGSSGPLDSAVTEGFESDAEGGRAGSTPASRGRSSSEHSSGSGIASAIGRHISRGREGGSTAPTVDTVTVGAHTGTHEAGASSRATLPPASVGCLRSRGMPWRPHAGERGSDGAVVRFAFRYGPPTVRYAIASALGWAGSGLAAAAPRAVRQERELREELEAEGRMKVEEGKHDSTSDSSAFALPSMVTIGLHGAQASGGGKWDAPVPATMSGAPPAPGTSHTGSCGPHGCPLAALGFMGKKVEPQSAVVGGGDAASDAVGSTSRHGASARLGPPSVLGPLAPDGLPLWLPAHCPALDGEYCADDVDWMEEGAAGRGCSGAGHVLPRGARAVRLDFFDYDWRSNAAS